MKDKPETVAFYTLGCKVNSYDTLAMEQLFEKAGYQIVPFDQKADVYLINTCTVTHLGDRKSRQMLRRARRLNPEALIVATGCYAQTNPDDVLGIDEVNLILGTDQRARIVEDCEKAIAEQTEKSDLTHSLDGVSFEELEISRTDGHTRAYVKVQEGCRQFCSYCIVPYARGPLRSRSLENSLNEIRRLADAGFKEIVLTGIHIASYGNDFSDTRNTETLNEELITLIEQASEIDGIERIRLSSIEPRLMSEAFLKRLAKIEKLCPHFHLSLQSGSNRTLRRMNRHYSKEDYYAIVERIRRYFENPALTTDVIVGFPGETNEDFEESLEFVQQCAFNQVHLFKYSPRKGTPAAKMKEQIDPQVKAARFERLAEAERAMRHAALQRDDHSVQEILLEQSHDKGIWTGHTKDYHPVSYHVLNPEENYQNQIIKTMVFYKGDDILTAYEKDS